MSNDGLESAGDHRESDGDEEAGVDADLAAQVELLVEENRRLREEYVRARRNTNRKTGVGLLAVGLVAAVGAVAFPASRTVLFALGGTGLFASVLIYYVTPARFVSVETGERVYAAFARTGAELVAELGLQDDRVYVPVRTTDEGVPAVRLFVPNRSDFTVPDPEQLGSLFVVTDSKYERGVSLSATGSGLYREFEAAMVDDVAETPTELAGQLADALVESFELAEGATADVDPDDGRATFGVSGGVYGSADRFDHPLASFLAVGMAAKLDVPVSLTVAPVEDGRADHFVTCEWDPAGVELSPPAQDQDVE